MDLGKMKNIMKKMDIRTHPDPKLAKKFDSSCGRRYVNVGLQSIHFFHGVADKIGDKELKEHAKMIEDAVYTKNGDMFEVNKVLFTERMKELGLWKSVKGMSVYHKMQVVRKFKKMVKEKGLKK